MADTGVLAQSVTAGDYADDPRGGVLNIFVGQSGQSVLDLPPYWTPARDYRLRATLQMEPMWAAAVAKAISKQAALGWKIDDVDQSSRRAARARELLLTANAGKGWVHFVGQHLRGFLLTDNGAFVEIVRATAAGGSRILGLVHLDSCRCTRTGDPEVPVLYRDLRGREHELRAHQVLSLSDMPDDSETYYGVGFCAASRAYASIAGLASIRRYGYEKVTGQRGLALYLVNGISDKKLAEALTAAEAAQTARGMVAYKGAILIPVLDDKAVSVATIPLSELPDGFDAEKERDDAYTVYANAIGVPVQDIKPLSGQGLGTGTQTVILDEAAEGQGLAAWRKQWEHLLNEWVLPASTMFSFATNDIRDQKARAEVQQARAATRAAQIASGEITPEQALQMAADDGDVPKEFLPNDETASDTLLDTQKPVTEGGDAGALPEAMKAARDADALWEEELGRARVLARLVRNG